jgi:microcystin-dependent protein
MKYIKRKSAVKLSPITGSIVDTTNITDKKSNTYSARIFEEMLTIATNASMPVGSGIDFFGTTPPENYMFADGRAISRTEYSELFSIIGTTYGTGDGSTTFNLPDKRERVSVMANYPELNLYDMQTKTLSDGSKWARIYYHNSQNGTVIFNSVNEVKNVQSTDKYSRLYLLDDNRFKGSDGKFEFMLCYPDNSTSYNRWKQTNSPCNEYVPTNSKYTVEGYVAGTISWSTHWGGLARHSEDPTYINKGGSYIKGNIGMTSWWYALAPFTVYEGGVPGFHNGTDNVIVTGKTELWVRYDHIKYLGRSFGYTAIEYTPKGTIGGTALTVAQIPEHNHQVVWYDNVLSADSGTDAGYIGINWSKGKASTGANLKTRTKGGNATHTHTWTGAKAEFYPYQPSLVCNYIIKVKNDTLGAFDIVTEMLGGAY